ncbi:MAG: hypothetical protein AB1760_00350 [Pseudomonadota bacterium]
MPDIDALNRYRRSKRAGEEVAPVYGPFGQTGGTPGGSAVLNTSNDDGDAVSLSWKDANGDIKQVRVPKPATPVSGKGTTAPVPSGLSSLSPNTPGLVPMGTSGTAEAYQEKVRSQMDRNTMPVPSPGTPSPAPAPSPPQQSAIPGVTTPPVMAKETPKAQEPAREAAAPPSLSMQAEQGGVTPAGTPIGGTVAGALTPGGAFGSALQIAVPSPPAALTGPGPEKPVTATTTPAGTALTGIATPGAGTGGLYFAGGQTAYPSTTTPTGMGAIRQEEAKAAGTTAGAEPTTVQSTTTPSAGTTTPAGTTTSTGAAGTTTPATTATGTTGTRAVTRTGATGAEKTPAQRWQDLANQAADAIVRGDTAGAWAAMQAANVINGNFKLGNPMYTPEEAGIKTPTSGPGGGGQGEPAYDPNTGIGSGGEVREVLHDDKGNVVGYVGLDGKRYALGGGAGGAGGAANPFAGESAVSKAGATYMGYLQNRVNALPTDEQLRQQANLQARLQYGAKLSSIQRARAQARAAAAEEQGTLNEYLQTATKNITDWADRQKIMDAEKANRQGLYWGGYLAGLVAQTEKEALDKIGETTTEIGKQIANVARRLTARLSDLSDEEIATMSDQAIYEQLQYLDAQIKNKQERAAVEAMMGQLQLQLAEAEDRRAAEYAAYLNQQEQLKQAAAERAAATAAATPNYTAIPGFPDYLNRQGISITQFNSYSQATKDNIYAEYQREKQAGATEAKQPTFNYPAFNDWLRNQGLNPDIMTPGDREVWFNIWQNEQAAKAKQTAQPNNGDVLNQYLDVLGRLAQIDGIINDPLNRGKDMAALETERDNLLAIARTLAAQLGMAQPPGQTGATTTTTPGGSASGGTPAAQPGNAAASTVDPAVAAWVKEQQQAGIPDGVIAAELRANGLDPKRYGLREE